MRQYFGRDVRETGNNTNKSLELNLIVKISHPTNNQGCGVGVDIGVRVGRSRPFRPESELESVKFCRRRLRTRAAECVLSIDDNLGRTVIEITKTLKCMKKKSSSTHVTLKRHFAIELSQINEIGGNFKIIAIAVPIKFSLSAVPIHSKEAPLTHGPLEPPSACSGIGTLSLLLVQKSHQKG